MRKNIDIDEDILFKLKMLSAFENTSVKVLMEKAVTYFVAQKEKERMDSFTKDQKEDIGLFFLMQQANRNDQVSKESVMNLLDE